MDGQRTEKKIGTKAALLRQSNIPTEKKWNGLNGLVSFAHLLRH
jgi:hypothetical protein